MKILLKNITFILALSFVLIVVLIRTNVSAESGTFPVYSSIKPNVDFWKKIYTEYSSDQCVIHDKRNLDIIYGVIKLKNPEHTIGRKINRKRIKKAKKKYKQVLAKLIRGENPLGVEEQQVADLFAPDAKLSDYRTAMRNIRCQVGQKELFRKSIIRSGAYIEEIKQIFREFGLPEDLAYLPHVESSFNSEAYSKFGAAGIWQFIRSTGRRFMTVSYTVDERRDPILSTRAAARLLKRNYDMLQSWPMAITAYNHGITGLLRAKRIKGNYERIFKEYRSRIFKFASRNFYSEFIAAYEVAKNYRQYFGALKLDTPVNVTEVVLNGYVSLPELARHLKLDIEVVSKFNLALRRPVIRGQKYVPKGYHLRLPADIGKNWNSMIAELSPNLFKHFQKRSRIHTVRRGDTVGEIAKVHQVKLHDLIAANNLDYRATIYINQNLRIPLPDDKPIKLSKLENRKQKEKDFAKSPKSPPIEAQPLKTPIDLASEKLTRDKAKAESQPEINLGKVQPEIYVPQVNPEIIQANLAVERVWNQNGKNIGAIRAEVEETLGHYAEWLGVTASEIRRLNGFPYGRIIRVDQQIKIPLHRVSKEEFEERRFEYHKELTEDFFATYRVDNVEVYHIKRGDNIWTLSREEFEVPLWLIKRYNSHINFYKLVPSQELLIPVVEKIV